ALLRFHAALGGSVIALSATLPQKLTADLIDSWRTVTHGAAAPRDAIAPSDSYPLVTSVTTRGVVAQTPIEPAAWSQRTIPIRTVHGVGDVVTALLDAARGGAAAVWIRNTVDSCLEAAEL